MARFTASAFSNAVAEMVNAYALFIELRLDSGTRYLTTLPFDYSFGGHTYTGGGIILDIDPVSEQQGFASTQLLFHLQGSEYETIARGENYHNRVVILYWAFIHVDTWQPLATPEELWRGFIDVMALEQSAEERFVSVSCEHEFLTWRRAINLLNSDEHQRAYVDANDAFFNQAALVGAKPLEWGKRSVKLGESIARAAIVGVQGVVNKYAGIAASIGSIVNPALGAALAAYAWGWSKYYDSMLAKQREKIGNTEARETNVTGGVQPAQIIYGEIQTAGQIVFVGLSDDNQRLWYVVVVASHQVEEIGDIWVDDRRISPSDISGTAVTLASFQDTGGSCLGIWKYLGRHDDTALSDLITAFPGIWTSNHRGVGVAKVVFSCFRSDKAFPQGAPRQFKFVVKGKRCYDRRKDSTNGGSGSHRVNDATTWEWTRDPAVITEDYKTGGSKYFSTATPLRLLGMKIDSTRINGTFAAAAANECDTLVDLPEALFLVPASHYTSITYSGPEVTVSRVDSSDVTTTDYAYSTRSRLSIDLLISDVTSGEIGITASLGQAITQSGGPIRGGYSMSIGSGSVQVYNNTTLVSTTGGVTGATTFRITYDGATVTFYKDAGSIYTVAETRPMFIVAGVCINNTAAMTLESQIDEQEEKYTCDIQLSCDAEHQQNLGKILATMLGNVSPVNGQFRIHAGTYATPVKSIGDSDVVGPVAMITHPSGEETFNTVQGVFYDEARNWELVPFPPITSLSYQTADGGEFVRDIVLEGTRGSFRAQRISSQVLKQSRNKITIAFNELSPKAADIAAWENFYLNLTEFGYVNQVARCLEWSLLKNGSIRILCRLDAASTYDDFDPADYAQPDAQPPSFAQTQRAEAPNALTVTSYAGAIGFVVGFANPLPANTKIEIWEHTSNSPFSSASVVARGVGQTSFLLSKNDTTQRFYWATAELNGQVSTNYPASTGTSGRALPALTPNALTATGIAGGIVFNWGASGDQPPGTRWRLYEHTANSPFSSAVLIHETDALGWTKIGDTPTAKFYWVKAYANGTLSSEYPSGNGVSGQGLAPVAATSLTLTGFPTYIRVSIGGTFSQGTLFQLWEHTSNSPFSSATKITEFEANTFYVPKRDTTTRYYWVTTKLSGQTSTNFPSGNGVAGAADLTKTGDIDPNAATEIYEDYDTGPTTVPTLTATNVLQITFTAASAGIVQATFGANVSTSDTESGSPVFLQLITDSGSVGDVPTNVLFDTTPIRLSLMANQAVAQGDDVEVNFLVGALDVSLTVTDARLRVELIKR